MSLTLFIITLLFIFTGTTTASPENLIATLKSKNITSVHLHSPSPETISQFSNTNISLLLTIPNSLIPTISSNPYVTSAWLSAHVTPFLPHVLISAISVGNNVTDADLLKLLIPAIDNVKEKLREVGINEVKVSITVSFSFVNVSDYVAKESLGSLSQKNPSTLFVSMGNRDVPVGFCEFKVVGGFVLIHDPGSDFIYESFDDGEMMDYGVVEVSVSKVEEDMVKKELSWVFIVGDAMIFFDLTTFWVSVIFRFN